MSGARIPVSVMIFTLNEEVNLPACLESLGWSDDIILVDSFSTDATQDIARKAGTRIFQHGFTGFGDQRNWALKNTDPKHEWILLLDADERVSGDLADEMRRAVSSAVPAVAAFRLKRRLFMWGKWLRHSSLYPTWVVRLVRKGKVRFVNRGHAETQEVFGEVSELQSDLIDENLKGMDDWWARQARYSVKEAEFELRDQTAFRWAQFFSGDPLLRRAALKRAASRLPARAAGYFLYSYLVRLGFLDGWPGFRFCMMKAKYYGMIVSKKKEISRGGPRP